MKKIPQLRAKEHKVTENLCFWTTKCISHDLTAWSQVTRQGSTDGWFGLKHKPHCWPSRLFECAVLFNEPTIAGIIISRDDRYMGFTDISGIDQSGRFYRPR